MSEQMGRFTVDSSLMCDLLHLPEGTRILRYREHPDMLCGTASIEILVSGPHLPAVDVGAMIPEVRPKFHRDGETVKFIGYEWGKE
jgi:hypothetical protein